jgi:dephospho-CoA kinase
MTKIIGLTGGIGSGKTTIANYFQTLGIPVYIADAESKKIANLPEVIARIKETFGAAIFDHDTLNRIRLAELVFKNPQKLKALSAIIHPRVQSHFSSWVDEHAKYPLIIKEAAILFESGSYKDCDSVISVTAPLEIRIQRIMDRDKVTRQSVLDRINNQWTDEQRVANSDFVIENSNLKEAQRQADEILKKLTIQ